ncbi:MAG: hypothetical protein KBT30_00545, partial [Clostridiales bacterium]|nr:hypothetical protein [Candidatus Apopatousia equi]
MEYSKELMNLIKSKGCSIESLEQTLFLALENTFEGKELEQVKEKIKDLKVDVKMTGSGHYDYLVNTVYLMGTKINNEEIFVHEFFHAISTRKNDDIVNIGLNQLKHKRVDKELVELNIGTAINEGSNTYFTKTVLEKIGKSEYFGNIISSYRFCTNIYACLVKFLGEEECKHAHFFGGINEFINLVKEKCYRETDSKVIKLINSMDCYFNVAKVYGLIGGEYGLEAKSLLVDCYNAMIDLYIFKCEKERKNIRLTDCLSDYCLIGTDKEYFESQILPQLYKHFAKRIVGIGLKKRHKEHLDFDAMEEYAINYLNENMKENAKLCGDNIPEKYKCGEFYNYLLTSCYFIDSQRYKEGIKTNDFQRLLTQAIFEKKNNFMPKDESKKVETMEKILSSRLAIRAGCEVSDEIVLDCLKNSREFNNFIIEIDPEYYYTLFKKIEGKAKFD